MGVKRTKSSGVSTCTCDKCGIKHPSTVKGSKHRRCGGFDGAPIKPKHSIAGQRGTWL